MLNIFVNSLWAYFICAFFGWLIQFAKRIIEKHDFSNIGFITLPFSPGYGTGGAIAYLFLYKADNLLMIFFGGMLLFTSLKVGGALIFEKIFGFKWIDYSSKKLNLNGYVTAFEVLYFGIVSLVLAYAVFPLINFVTGLMVQWVALLVASIVTGLIIADYIVSVISVFHLRKHLKQMKNISDLIEEEYTEKPYEELQSSYEKKIMKDKAFRKRLIKTFPDMEYANYQKQFDDIKYKLELIKEHNDAVYENKIENEGDKPFAYGLNFTKLFWLFVVGSFFGTIVETIYCIVTRGHFEMRVGLVWGPFIPVYGGGAVLVTLCLYKLYKANNFVVYAVSAVVGATFEYFCSLFQEHFLGTVSWDYTGTPFNIGGRTNLKFALMWGLLGLVWVRYIYPAFCYVLEKMPKKIGKIITIFLVIFMIINSAVSMYAIHRKTERSKDIPAQGIVDEFFDEHFDDEYLDFIYPNMMQVDK